MEMEPAVAGLLKQRSSQGLANIAWSYAVADVDASRVFGKSFARALLENMNSFDVAGLVQLYQWHLWQTEKIGNADLPPILERSYNASPRRGLQFLIPSGSELHSGFERRMAPFP